MIKLNAAGNLDPLPIVRDALAKNADDIQILGMDTAPALRVRQFLEGKGFSVQIQDDNGQLTLTGSHRKLPHSPGVLRAAPPQKRSSQAQVLAAPIIEPHKTNPLPATARQARPTYLILNRVLGQDAQEKGRPSGLGEILMKSFLGALTKAVRYPEAIILMNEGVKLALFNTSTCDNLKALEAQGVRVLVSGTCALHLGITENIGAGVLANMHEIIGELGNAEKCITI
ncbi:MAG: hypothetical protein K5841_05225 [Fretibacterium sp.]|nr:hypothetical protein [Fretibacterium sp.]